MNYHLRTRVIGPAPELPLSAEQFQRAKITHGVLVASFALEETFDLVLSNYIEIEKDLLCAAVEEGTRTHYGYDDFFELRSTINRRVVNLLTATRLYLDQAPQHLATCTANDDIARKSLKAQTAKHYDSCLSYRLLEALRNHVQHSGLAVHRLSINNKWVGEPKAQNLHVSIQPFTSRRYLEADGKFKKSVLSELPAEIDIAQAIREYLERLGDIHKLMRTLVAPHALHARSIIQSHIDQYARANNDQTVGLAAIRTDTSGCVEEVPIFLAWDDVRLKLVARNSTLGALAKRAISGRPQ